MTATATREQAPTSRAAEKSAKAAKSAKKSPLKSKKALIPLVLLIVAAGAYFTVLKPKPVEKPVGGDVVALDPTTVNLTDGHYLKVAVAVQLVQGKGTATDFKPSHAAELVIDEFADRSITALSSNTARQKLTDDLEKKIKSAYPDEVFSIFLTQFVTQ